MGKRNLLDKFGQLVEIKGCSIRVGSTVATNSFHLLYSSFGNNTAS
jgi:hypothetical protein